MLRTFARIGHNSKPAFIATSLHYLVSYDAALKMPSEVKPGRFIRDLNNYIPRQHLVSYYQLLGNGESMKLFGKGCNTILSAFIRCSALDRHMVCQANWSPEDIECLEHSLKENNIGKKATFVHYDVPSFAVARTWDDYYVTFEQEWWVEAFFGDINEWF